MAASQMIAKRFDHSVSAVSQALSSAPDSNSVAAARSYKFDVLVEDAVNAGLTHGFLPHPAEHQASGGRTWV